MDNQLSRPGDGYRYPTEFLPQLQGCNQMKESAVLFTSVLALLLTATSVQAGIFPYGQRQVEEAGAGCVGGLFSAHGNHAYFRGDTARLNEQMASLAKDAKRYQSIKVVLHVGTKTVDPAEETLQTGFNSQTQTAFTYQKRDTQVPIDWSVLKACSFENAASGLCKHDERWVSVDVWIGAAIRLDDLNIPSEFTVQSGGEIEDFAERHPQDR